jgi:hypothetical protein
VLRFGLRSRDLQPRQVRQQRLSLLEVKKKKSQSHLVVARRRI